MVKRITENTGISIGLVVILAGGIYWLSELWFRTEATAKDQTKMAEVLESIDRRLFNIEFKLGVNPHEAGK